MLKKFSLLSVARARTIIVFEQPGGPNIKIPLGLSILNLENVFGYFNGQTTACCNCFFQ